MSWPKLVAIILREDGRGSETSSWRRGRLRESLGVSTLARIPASSLSVLDTGMRSAPWTL